MPFPSVGQSTLTTALLNPYGSVLTNPIINGGFEIWQRGTIFNSIATGTYCADRWATSFTSSTGVFNITQSSDVPPVAALMPITNYSLLVTTATADNSVAIGESFAMRHAIEGYNWAPFAQKQITIGFWVKVTGTGVTGIYSVSLRNSGQDRVCVAEFTVSSLNTWEYKTITFPASPSAGTWDYTTGAGVYLYFALMCGSTNTTSTIGSWQSASSLASTNQINAVGTNSNTFRLWGVTMGLGPTVQPYFPRPYPIELALCQRYYERQNANNANARFGWVQYVNSGGSWQGYIQILPKRLITASVTFGSTAVNGFGIDPTIGRSINAMSQLATTCSGYTFYGIQGTTTSSAASGNVSPIYCLNASDYMEFGAEL